MSLKQPERRPELTRELQEKEEIEGRQEFPGSRVKIK